MFRLSLSGAEGAEGLARRLALAAVKLTIGAEATAAGLAHTAEGIVTPLLREESPVDTGALRDSLRAHVSRDGTGFVVRFESDVPYADYVEHGTGIYHQPDAHSTWNGHEGQHPNPFAERAYDRAEPAIRAALVLAGARILLSFSADVVRP
jgi:HK97 gp10 family phage protein